MTRELAIRLALFGFSVSFLLVAGEIVCRLFLPDTHLRYVSDRDTLYYFEPNQVGIFQLNNGLPSPPIRINQLGFRGDEVKSVGDKILVLGDSFTFGVGVGDHETFSALLSQYLNSELSVINGGQPGYGVFQMEATLRRVGDILRPNLVIVVLWQGDFLRQPPDAIERERFFRRRNLLKMLKTSVFLTHVYRRLERTLLHFGQESLVVRVGEGGRNTELDSKSVVESHLRGFEADVQRLVAMHREARRYGRGLLLVLWPKEDFADLAEEGLAERLTDALAAFSHKHNIPFISVQSAMRHARPASLLIPNDWHPTPLAHCLVAQVIADTLRRLEFPVSQSLTCSAS